MEFPGASATWIWYCHCCGSGCCCGMGLISGLGTSTCHRCTPPPQKCSVFLNIFGTYQSNVRDHNSFLPIRMGHQCEIPWKVGVNSQKASWITFTGKLHEEGSRITRHEPSKQYFRKTVEYQWYICTLLKSISKTKIYFITLGLVGLPN